MPILNVNIQKLSKEKHKHSNAFREDLQFSSCAWYKLYYWLFNLFIKWFQYEIFIDIDIDGWIKMIRLLSIAMWARQLSILNRIHRTTLNTHTNTCVLQEQSSCHCRCSCCVRRPICTYVLYRKLYRKHCTVFARCHSGLIDKNKIRAQLSIYHRQALPYKR